MEKLVEHKVYIMSECSYKGHKVYSDFVGYSYDKRQAIYMAYIDCLWNRWKYPQKPRIRSIYRTNDSICFVYETIDLEWYAINEDTYWTSTWKED